MDARKIYEEAFNVPRDPRSTEYKQGVIAALRHRCDGVETRRPYKPGTAQYDAWRAGHDEGHSLYREWERRRP